MGKYKENIIAINECAISEVRSYKALLNIKYRLMFEINNASIQIYQAFNLSLPSQYEIMKYDTYQNNNDKIGY